MIPTLKRPNIWLFILLLAPFVRPVGLDHFPLVGKILTLWKLLALVYLAVALIPKLLSPHPRKATFCLAGLALFWVIYVANCMRLGLEVVSTATAGVSAILLFLLVEYETRSANGMILLKATYYLAAFYIIAHILSVFLVKAGLLWMGYVGESPVYLFGMDNYSAFFIYPMLTLALYYQSLRYGRLRISGWLLLFGVVGIYLLTKSLTAAGGGMVLLMLIMVKGYWKDLPKVRGIRWLVGAMALILVLICGFQVQNLIASLLDNLSKGVTLNSRTYIWDSALQLIRQRPLLGHGTFTEKALYDEYILYGTSHAHNLLLELLLRTGIVGTAGYLVFLCGFSAIGRRRPVSKSHGILIAGLVSQLVLMFMDYYPTILPFYLFLGVMYFSYRLAEKPQYVHHNDLQEDAP